MRTAAIVSVLGAVVAVVVLLIQGLIGGDPGASNITNGGPAGGAYNAGLGVNVGQVADFSFTVQNDNTVPVTLISATLLPVPGYPLPKVRHIAVLEEHEDLFSGPGWPPSTAGCSIRQGICQGRREVFTTRPLAGFQLKPAREAPGPLPYMVIVGVAENAPGNYATAGLLLRFRIGDSVGVVRVYDGAEACVSAGARTSCNDPGRFTSAFEKASGS